MSNLHGRTFVVTGAASGIGRATTSELVANGGNVVLIDINESDLVDAAKGLDDRNAAYLALDVAEEANHKEIVSFAIDRFGAIHGAVLNVGIPGEIKSIVDTDVEMFDKVMSVNVRGTWLGLKYLIPEIARQENGSIVLTGSTAGFRAGAPGRAPYVASKHAVIGLMRAAAAECAALGIRVNSVSPGGVRTPMTESVKTILGEEEGEAVLQGFEETIPLKRLGKPDEIASAILFLLGDESRYCTSTNIMVDGGLMG